MKHIRSVSVQQADAKLDIDPSNSAIVQFIIALLTALLPLIQDKENQP